MMGGNISYDTGRNSVALLSGFNYQDKVEGSEDFYLPDRI
jgi:hypothetical protein